MATQLVHFEIPARDTGRARKFYGELLGWSFDSADGIDYHLVRDTTPPGALTAADGAGPAIYFGVEDLDAALAVLATLGGSHEPPQEIPGVGRYAACRDDQGTAFSLYQPAAGQGV
jgi:predicted enzyme related to lactoylglutathione lyase